MIAYFSPQISHYEITACACLEQVASLRSARQAHADATELDSLYSKIKARRRAMLPLHRLQSFARFSTCGFSFLSLVLRLFSFSLLFGVCLLFQPKLRRYIRLRSNMKNRQKEATFYLRFLLWRQRLCP